MLIPLKMTYSDKVIMDKSIDDEQLSSTEGDWTAMVFDWLIHLFSVTKSMQLTPLDSFLTLEF